MWWSRRRVREPRGRHRQTVPPVAQRVPASAFAPPHPPRDSSGVHLGFRDGTTVELASGDPRIGAFRAVAQTLQR